MRLSHFVTIVVLIPILDYFWLGWAMKSFYIKQLGPIARLTESGNFAPLLVPALIVYVILAFSLSFFVLPRAGTVLQAFIFGALLGGCIYGVYDFTNLSTLKNWTLAMAIVDTAWGATVSGIVSATAKKLFP